MRSQEDDSGALSIVIGSKPMSCVRKPYQHRAVPRSVFFSRIPTHPPAHPIPDKERWPSQTRSEDANQGLEPCLAALVTTARQWLVERGFLKTDGPLAGVVGGNSGHGGGGGGAGGGGGGPYGVGWRKVVVARTHAAMCASALLTPGWGAGHQIMGAAEQVTLVFGRPYSPAPHPRCPVVDGGVWPSNEAVAWFCTLRYLGLCTPWRSTLRAARTHQSAAPRTRVKPKREESAVPHHSRCQLRSNGRGLPRVPGSRRRATRVPSRRLKHNLISGALCYIFVP